ncbi:hypothetical protein [Paenibacillus rigui]|nr:hypothetical protein [Paenibacillus rigui]
MPCRGLTWLALVKWWLRRLESFFRSLLLGDFLNNTAAAVEIS